jgi:hypothetical protein
MAIKNYVTLVEKWEEDKYTPKAASTAMANGQFLTYDGSGGAIPATPGDPILGVCMEDVTAADVDYTSTRKIAYQTAYNNYFNITVSAGTATAAMVGLPFDLDTASTLDVSGAGTQVEITNFISATQVEVKVIDFA